MKVLSKAREIDAVQWTGDAASVVSLQRLVAPLSPYCTVNVAGEDKPVSCGVPCKGAKVYQIADLTFIDVGAWVTKDDQGVISAWTNAQFQATFCAPALLAALPLDLKPFVDTMHEDMAQVLHGDRRAPLDLPITLGVTPDPRD